MNVLRQWFHAYRWRYQMRRDTLSDDQQSLIVAVRHIRDWQDLSLAQARTMLDLLIAWRISIEQPEIDLRDDVDSLINSYRDQVARLEEQIVSE